VRKPAPFPLLGALGFLFLGIRAGFAAGTFQLDLATVANQGFQVQAGVGGGMPGSTMADLKGLPTGLGVFLGVPFQVLDPARNGGKSLVVLKGSRAPDLPVTAEIPLGNRKAGWLYFLQTCIWPGLDKAKAFARYEILYKDGGTGSVPLRVGIETAGWWGPGKGDACLTAWTVKFPAAEGGLQLFAWKNPRPDQPIRSLTLRSLGKLPIPILVAVTGSTEPIDLEIPKEKPLDPPGALWPAAPAPESGSRSSALPLDAPKPLPPGPWNTKAGHWVDESGKRIRVFGVALPAAAWDWPEKDVRSTVTRLSAEGFNLVSLPWRFDAPDPPTTARALWGGILRESSMSLELTFSGERPDPTACPTPCGPNKDPLENWKDLPIVLGRFEDPSGAAPDPQAFRTLGWSRPIGRSLGADGAEDKGSGPGFDYAEASFGWDVPQASPDGLARFDGEALSASPAKWDLPEACATRRSGQPFIGRFRGGWPNPYAVELPVLAATQAAFQDWDGVLLDQPEGLGDDPGSAGSPFAALWPGLSIMFLRGDLAPARRAVGIPPTGVEGTRRLASLGHRMMSEGGAPPALDPAAAKIERVSADNDRWVWQGNIGLFRAGAPAFQAFTGFLAHRDLSNYAWTVDTPNLFSSFTMVSTTGEPTLTAKRLWITAAARYEREGAKFNRARTAMLVPPTDGIRLEPIQARISVVRQGANAVVRAGAFDLTGERLTERVALQWKGKVLSFKWPPGASSVLLDWGPVK